MEITGQTFWRTVVVALVATFTITAWDGKPDRKENRRYFDAGADRVVHVVITKDEKSAIARLGEMAAELL